MWWLLHSFLFILSYSVSYIYNHIHTVYSSISIRRGLSPFLHCLLLRWKNLLGCRAEIRTQSCPTATKRALPTELRCTLTELSCTLAELRCTLTELRCTLTELRCILTELRCTLAELRCTLTELRCTLTELRCTLIELQYAAP